MNGVFGLWGGGKRNELNGPAPHLFDEVSLEVC